ncbi:MAG: hypothetical protein KJN93_04460 [Alphaproteobacteria bacterium]|nr:hypothetical protein [Alphaproteobacteria bacterium]
MSGPGDGARLLMTVLIAAWIAAFAFGFFAHVALPSDPATDSPNVFLGWQAVAGIIAIAVFGVSRQWPKGAAVRRLGAFPLIVAVLVALGTLGVVFWVDQG